MTAPFITHGKTITMADDGTFTWLTLTVGGLGFLMVGTDDDRTLFTIDEAGTVNLLMASANIVANADTDGKFCIGTAATQNPLILKNRLGSSKTVQMGIAKT